MRLQRLGRERNGGLAHESVIDSRFSALGLHRHQQRKLMLFGRLTGRLELGFGDVMGIDAGKRPIRIDARSS